MKIDWDKFAMTFMTCLLAWCLHAQGPFICQGNYYLALTDGTAFTKVYEVEIDTSTGSVVFDPLSSGTSGADLNAIGYRYSDNYIYGINSADFALYRVGTDGLIDTLYSFGADPYLQYVAGDVSPDGRFLVVVGTSSFQDEVLIFIDLDSPEYEYTELWLSGLDVRSADIAFDPTDGQLYGFDGIHQHLVLYDITTGEVTSDFPTTSEALLMGGLFFDPFGNLYGYGLVPGENAQQAFFSIDKNTGVVTLESTGPPASRNDGCSCPYTVALTETVDTIDVVSCTEVPITIEIANTSKMEQSDLRLEQSFPESFEIVSMNNPLESTLVDGGPGTNFFILDGLNLPLGQHQITITVALAPEALGTYAFQATLSGLPERLGGSTVSDNPLTLIERDSTILNVGELEVDFSQINNLICSGEGLVLDPGITGASYVWSDGSTEPTLTVTQGGTYAVTISSACETVEETITVDGIGFELDLGPDLQIELGESLTLRPNIVPSSEGLTYSWTSSAAPLSCMSCFEPEVNPYFDTRYYLTATDAAGCSVMDSVLVEVIKNRKVYAPNAFSPNGDGINDYFYLQSEQPETVLNFQVFNRWGDLVFESANIPTNEPSQGWDGRFRGKPLNNGVYFYLATIRFLDGEVVEFQGMVEVVR